MIAYDGCQDYGYISILLKGNKLIYCYDYCFQEVQ